MEPEITNVTDMTEFLRVVENIPDHDINFRNGKTLTIKVNSCNAEDQSVRNIPRYPQMRLDPHPLGKKMKVPSLEQDTQKGAEYAPIRLSTYGKSLQNRWYCNLYPFKRWSEPQLLQ